MYIYIYIYMYVLCGFPVFSTLFQNLTGISPEFIRNSPEFATRSSPEFHQNIELEHLEKGITTTQPSHICRLFVVYRLLLVFGFVVVVFVCYGRLRKLLFICQLCIVYRLLIVLFWFDCVYECNYIDCLGLYVRLFVV